MMNNEICPCCSGIIYSECCQPYHQGALPTTAEKLMRSRYSAYAFCLPDYLIDTTHPTKRKSLNKDEIVDWSKENKWLKLEILKAAKSMVEFKAHFEDQDGTTHIHHELSTFTLDKGKWFYVKGSFY